MHGCAQKRPQRATWITPMPLPQRFANRTHRCWPWSPRPCNRRERRAEGCCLYTYYANKNRRKAKLFKSLFTKDEFHCMIDKLRELGQVHKRVLAHENDTNPLFVSRYVHSRAPPPTPPPINFNQPSFPSRPIGCHHCLRKLFSLRLEEPANEC